MKTRFAIALVCVLSPLLAGAQESVITPDTYGTNSLTYVSLGAWDFHPRDSTTMLTGDGSFGLSVTSGNNTLEAPVHLPAGALVSYMELYACDNSAGNYVVFFRGARNDGTWSFAPPAGLDSSSLSGCGTVSVTFSPVQVSNSNTSYTVELTQGIIGTTLSFRSVRVGYKLQVSPDPMSTTFTDVPLSHPFHRFIEALYASGIAAGCGGGNYCPDQPVTRGQMAVFLATALGLHFAP